MEKSSKRGKIPQSDWPLIMARYEAGETLASIARTYDCSPPAISYVVSRSRARHSDSVSPPTPPTPSEPQLIKASATESVVAGPATPPQLSTPGFTLAVNGFGANALRAFDAEAQPEAAVANPFGRRDEIPLRETAPRETNGFARNGIYPPSSASRQAAAPLQRPPAPLPASPPASPSGLPPSPSLGAQANGGDQRRTLHLSLGNTPHGNGNSQPIEQHPAPRPDGGERPNGERPNFANRSQPAQSYPGSAYRGGEDAGANGFGEVRPAAFDDSSRRGDANGASRKEGGTFIDGALRARVDSDIAVFLAAFDAALAEDTQESRSALRDATDRLLRVGARTRIELERLEARIPLPARDNIGGSEPAWRHR